MRPIRLHIALLALGLSLQGAAWAQDAKPQPDKAIEAQLKALDFTYEIDKDGDF